MWIWRVAASRTSQDSALEAAGVWQQQGSAHRSGTQIHRRESRWRNRNDKVGRVDGTTSSD